MRARRRIHVRPRARQDVDEVADYLAETNVATGRRFFDAAQRAFRRLSERPGIGSPRHFANLLMAGLRSWSIRGFERFLVFYRPTDDGIEVVRVLHGARDVDAILEAQED